MRNLALSVALIAGLFLPMGAIHAQSTETVTATCKDGTPFTGTKRSGACRGHGGVQSWGTAATSPGAAPSQPAPVTSQRAAPSPGGAGQVWSIQPVTFTTARAHDGTARPSTAASCPRRRPKRRAPGRTTERPAPLKIKSPARFRYPPPLLYVIIRCTSKSASSVPHMNARRPADPYG